MYFDKFNSLKNEMLQIMDATGKIVKPELMPKISDDEVLTAYKLMCLSRRQDDFQNKIQRQGRMLSFLSSTGQEATEVAYGMQIIKGKDWFSSAYRNNSAWLATGVPMRNIMLYWCGNELGSKMPEGINTLPVNIPIATQYSHATGLAFAEKYSKRDGVVITTTGDGGTSEGEFYEAINFAQLHEVPAIFIVENNQYAISTPCRKATKAINFAVKGVAVGMRNILVDGNDFFAVYAAVQEAISFARKGEGPSLIECYTYRLGAHSSADDPKVYRDEKLHEESLKKDPLIRLKAYLIAQKKWSDKEQEKLDAEQDKFIKEEFAWVEANNNVSIHDIFAYTYAEMPKFLEEQYQEAEAFFAKYPSKGGHH